jgi:RimJ/RimL family protein N-acetyltransferase
MTETDLELLAIQAEGRFDPRGRILDLYGITIACSEQRHALWLGAEVPDALASELAFTFDQTRASTDPAEVPAALEPCRRILEADGASLLRCGGPSFLIDERARFDSPVRIERSDRWNGQALRNANPGNWEPVEWNELLDGLLGPWAIAVEGEVVASICHTPGPVRARAAECGVWTHPAFRGRGYAAAVTSEWAAMMRPSARHLFYSTDAENLSSQSVARRLSLRPLGWLWRLGRATQHEQVHPLSTLRRQASLHAPLRPAGSAA